VRLDPELCVTGFRRFCRYRDVGKVQSINSSNISMVPYRHVKARRRTKIMDPCWQMSSM